MDTVGKIPEFTPNETPEGVAGEEEVKKETVEDTPEAVATPTQGEPEPEKETPSEPPAENTPASPEPSLDIETLRRQKEGLENEREKLLKEIVNLKGQRREIKQQQISDVEKKIDDLNDVHPEDVSTVEKILRAKGYMRREEAQNMLYEAVKQEEITKFLEKYPEYKPENDPNDLNWSSLLREVEYYRKPDDPHKIGEMMERAHRGVVGVPKQSNDRTVEIKKQQIQVAGVGSQGVQRSSSKKFLDSAVRQRLTDGGWSEEDITKIEQNL